MKVIFLALSLFLSLGAMSAQDSKFSLGLGGVHSYNCGLRFELFGDYK